MIDYTYNVFLSYIELTRIQLHVTRNMDAILLKFSKN